MKNLLFFLLLPVVFVLNFSACDNPVESVTDTLVIVNYDTVYTKDTLVIKDTTYVYDTLVLVNNDTLVSIDTLYINDTLTNCKLYAFFGNFLLYDELNSIWLLAWLSPLAENDWVQLLYFRAIGQTTWEDFGTAVFLGWAAPPTWFGDGVAVIDVEKKLLGMEYKIILIEPVAY